MNFSSNKCFHHLIILGDYAFFKENVAKPVTKSFLEKKKIHQYRIEQQRQEEEKTNEKNDKRIKEENMMEVEGEKEMEERIRSVEDQSKSSLIVYPETVQSTTLTHNPHSLPVPFPPTLPLPQPLIINKSDGVSTKSTAHVNEPVDETTANSSSSSGSGISRSKFLNAIELSAEGINVLKKLHGQVR